MTGVFRVPLSVDINLVEHAAPAGSHLGEPVTLGLPLPRGAFSATESWGLESSEGHLPLQARVLERWSDRSVRWALLDFQAPAMRDGKGVVTLRFDGAGQEPQGPTIRVTEEQEALSVDTGRLRVRLSRSAAVLLQEVQGPGTAFDGTRSELRIIGEKGESYEVTWRSLRVEEPGRLRTVVRADGQATLRELRLELTLRIHFFAGLPVVRVLLTIRNPRRAAHPGGIWELGDPGSVLLKEVSLVFGRRMDAPAAELRCSVEPGQPVVTCRRLELWQESSGGENWQSRVHVNRHGETRLLFRGFRMEVDGVHTTGLRATPVVEAADGKSSLAVAIPEFWQNFPKAVEAVSDHIAFGVFPRQHGDLHELQGGEQKTHDLYLVLAGDERGEAAPEWCRSRLLAHASPEWYCAAQAVPFLTPAADDPHREYVALVNAAIDGPDTFLHKREKQDEYGWRHFGDLVADHEAALSADPGQFVSHYNNQYDAIYGFGVQFLRSADPRWWVQMGELARHVVDIDVYHTDQDKAAYNHGMFWHTCHYTDAGRCTHRSFPRARGVFGGGPSNEHDYTTGLLLHHLLTGDPVSREAVLELARWVIDMDDGCRTVFRWLDRGPTGLASQTGATTYHGPGRGAAYSITTLLNAFRLSGDRGYLGQAEILLRRCIHPSDDIRSLDLLDSERRWSYIVFLQAVGGYLYRKEELGQTMDQSYAYARTALLRYARWMRQHEYPYLEKPEILEYPTETWAAQDMRKSEVFQHAGLHADGGERQQFLERARFFCERSLSMLGPMPSRTLTRPVVLLLSNGYWRAWCESAVGGGRATAVSVETVEFAEPAAFVPQKTRALRRAKQLAMAGGLTVLLASAVALVALFS